ncbi:MAG: PEP-CTERM sorting domain-containing protein [Acidobacteriia bacterium]|nr:PEP-CTERM sorting domain-containing protein [Terriglobia bacterium]
MQNVTGGYKTERDVLRILEQAQVEDTPLLRFVRAALAVNHGTNISSPRRRDDGPTSVVPEPGTISLLGTGLLGLAGVVRRRLGC